MSYGDNSMNNIWFKFRERIKRWCQLTHRRETLEQMQEAYFNSEDYIIPATIFHYKNKDSHIVTTEIYEFVI